jgi:hypothetical protein
MISLRPERRRPRIAVWLQVRVLPGITAHRSNGPGAVHDLIARNVGFSFDNRPSATSRSCQPCANRRPPQLMIWYGSTKNTEYMIASNAPITKHSRPIMSQNSSGCSYLNRTTPMPIRICMVLRSLKSFNDISAKASTTRYNKDFTCIGV